MENNEKLLAIIGARGVGKTTTLLQYWTELNLAPNKKLYISADWIDGEKLFDIAETFYKEEGKLLIIDEIHKYPNFEKELKMIYDILDIRVIVSGSSALSINHSKADLSRRMLLKETINVILEVNIPAVSNIKFNTIRKFKKLIEYICTSHPFKPNMQELLSKIDMPKTAYAEAYNYLELLQKAKVLRLIKSADKKDSILTKPEKIYLNNTNLHFCYCDNQEIGSIREVLFASMFDDFKIYAPKKGDFMIDGFTFEIGGKNKTKKQIKDIKNSFVVQDDIEIGSNKVIPLWLFGFLY